IRDFKGDPLPIVLETLRRPGAVAVLLTDTTYGLVARASDDKAVKRIYSLKRRAADKPFPYLFGATYWVERYCNVADPRRRAHVKITWPGPLGAYVWQDDYSPGADTRWRPLANHFWPGPLTIVLPAGDALPKAGLAGGDSVACRVPGDDFLLRIFTVLDEPLVAPSANIAGEPSPTSVEQVIETFESGVNLIVDGGTVKNPLASTVLDLTGEQPKILREGRIPISKISAVIGPVEI
ncbi:L-threonylcarbamoyladenylate synthase, partial [bacterium]|nr:L-threonylcarbamoyladenylate synthase [bacterium]